MIALAPPAIAVSGLRKTYILHGQGGVHIPVFSDITMTVKAGECVVLHGPSGAGKSTLLRCLYGNCRPDAGSIVVRRDDGVAVDLVAAGPRDILALRKRTLGYVSQFLRAVPRVSAQDVVAEPLRAMGVATTEARERARAALGRLGIPERLWALAPATFSGGEQQRVNIARSLVANLPILLLDEPTASLDAHNRLLVIDLIREAKQRGAAVVGVFHDDAVRDALADRLYPLTAEEAL